jgi:hypothetical protein
MSDEIVVGRPDVSASLPSHTNGIREGNARGNYGRQRGHLPDGRSTAARSTGINPGSHDPIEPGMPNLSPA